MALFSLKKISLVAENRQVYLRGIGGYNAGWVKETVAGPDAIYARRLTARVEEPSAAYQVEVGFDPAGEAEHMVCGCSRFRANRRGCKHIVAALVDLYYRDMTAGPASDTPAAVHDAPVTDPEAARLIDRYLTARRVRMTVEEQTLPPVTLTPTLILTGRTPVVTLAVCRLDGAGRDGGIRAGTDPHPPPPQLCPREPPAVGFSAGGDGGSGHPAGECPRKRGRVASAGR